MPVERVQFVVFEINTSVYLHQIAFVIMLQSKFNKMGECNLEQGSNLTFEVNSRMASTWSGFTSQKCISTRQVYSTTLSFL